MKKILCLTDFSENAYKGVLYAHELAKKFSCKLIFMHTYELSPVQEENVVHPSLIHYSDTESRDKLYKMCMEFTKENKYSKVSYEYIVKEGEVNHNLNKVIDEKNIDLVVLSTEGMIRPEDTYYGKVISDIIQGAACPILIIPVNTSFRDIKNIVYACNIEQENAIKKEAIAFARLFNSKLNVLSFNNEEDEGKSDLFYSKFSHLKKQSGYDQISFDLKASSEKNASLNQFAKDRQADLLILEHHRHLLMESAARDSFSKNFVFLSTLPVLIIPNAE